MLELAEARHRRGVRSDRAQLTSTAKDAPPLIRARLIQSGRVGADLAPFGVGQPWGVAAAQEVNQRPRALRSNWSTGSPLLALESGEVIAVNQPGPTDAVSVEVTSGQQ